MRIDPAITWIAITPSDNTELSDVKSLFIGVAGTIVLEGSDNAQVQFIVQDGQILPCQPKKVLATGTSASGIVGLK